MAQSSAFPLTEELSEDFIQNLVQQFEARTLPKEQWTHEAHLTAALWYLKNYSKAEATCYLRSGIITYNASLGGVNDPKNGYHETITLFWIWVIDQFLQHNDGTLVELTRQLLNSRYSSKQLPFLYYSKKRLLSTEARANWVEPDRKVLDFVGV